VVVGVGVDVAEGGDEGMCFGLLAILLLAVGVLLLLLGAVLVLVLVVVVLALGFVFVGAVGGEVAWLATIEAVVVPSPVLAVVVEAHEPPCDQGELLIIKNLQLLL